VVEFRHAHGAWVPYRLRTDKTMANTAHTARAVWAVMSAPITLAALANEMRLQARWTHPTMHNHVKRLLIAEHAGAGRTVLDLCCGQFGDLWKYLYVRTAAVVGLDASDVFLDEARNRVAGAAAVQRQLPLHMDAAVFPPVDVADPAAVAAVLGTRTFNTVAMFFCLPFFFRSAQTLLGLVRTIKRHLVTAASAGVPPARVIGITMDRAAVLAAFASQGASDGPAQPRRRVSPHTTPSAIFRHASGAVHMAVELRREGTPINLLNPDLPPPVPPVELSALHALLNPRAYDAAVPVATQVADGSAPALDDKRVAELSNLARLQFGNAVFASLPQSKTATGHVEFLVDFAFFAQVMHRNGLPLRKSLVTDTDLAGDLAGAYPELAGLLYESPVEGRAAALFRTFVFGAP
jgi:SAM-dependent methyltransferase